LWVASTEQRRSIFPNGGRKSLVSSSQSRKKRADVSRRSPKQLSISPEKKNQSQSYQEAAGNLLNSSQSLNKNQSQSYQAAAGNLVSRSQSLNKNQNQSFRAVAGKLVSSQGMTMDD